MITYSGIVEQGAGQATELAIPTANLPAQEHAEPGIYAARIMLADKHYEGVAYIGKAWLLDGAPERMEFHLFDYDGPSFYGESITVTLEEKLREPIEFVSEEEAKLQITNDIERAKTYFASN